MIWEDVPGLDFRRMHGYFQAQRISQIAYLEASCKERSIKSKFREARLESQISRKGRIK
jgi:hypothetical protein